MKSKPVGHIILVIAVIVWLIFISGAYYRLNLYSDECQALGYDGAELHNYSDGICIKTVKSPLKEGWRHETR